MNSKLESKKFLIPTEFYAAAPSFQKNKLSPLTEVEALLLRNNYRRRNYDQRIMPGDYFTSTREECSARMQVGLNENQQQCIGWVTKDTPMNKVDSSLQVLVIDSENQISQTFQGSPFQETLNASLEPLLVAQYIDNEPLMQVSTTLAEVPPMCSNAIMSIEDSKFLEHGGVSVRGIFRAFAKNITSGRKAQGGSTITQQLVKNYFLTSERTLKRKYQEFIMSILLESRFTKDQILETYLNIIYLGQNGPFQVRGYGAAARFYFGKDLANLDTPECALMAAIVNSPGLYNPFKKPENALKRRQLVLEKMKELKYITDSDYKSFSTYPLPTAPKSLAVETAPYYLDAVRKQLVSAGVNPEGLKIYTGLDLQAQDAAQQALNNHLSQLDTKNKQVSKLKEQGHHLEGAVLVGDNNTGLIKAVVGGRNFKSSQFNRAIDGHRQVGSIMKPFVYLTALLNNDENGNPYTPLSLIPDEKFTHKYDGQKWSPVNYGKTFYGEVPMFFALKNSLNSATAALGIKVGLNNVAEVAHIMGVESKFDAVPSMTLGAFEMYPKEVLKSYMTMATMGEKRDISFVLKAINEADQEVFSYNPDTQKSLDPKAIATLVGMMKQTIISGTARSIYLGGFKHPAAGKTGTTSDNKDAWFAGFTPYLTTVVWVGYDTNQPHKLTGSSGAVPVWNSFMKRYGVNYPPDEFAWPEGTVTKVLDLDTLTALGAIRDNDTTTEIELVFDKEKMPKQ